MAMSIPRAPSVSSSSSHAPATGGSVASCALAALHAEMVLYVVRYNAKQRAMQQVRELEERQANRVDEEDSDEESSDIGGAMDPQDPTSKRLTVDSATAVTDPRTLGVEFTLESMGIHAGQRMTERLLHREPLVRYTPLEITRFVGGQLWRAMFGKKVDRMKHLDSIYFSLVESNFVLHRCCTPSTASSGASPTGSKQTSGGASAGGSAAAVGLAPSAVVAPGYSADGTLLDADAAVREAKAVVEKSVREVPTPRDMLLFTQGVLRGVVETLMGPGNGAVVLSQTSGLTDAQFILDFRQCAK